MRNLLRREFVQMSQDFVLNGLRVDTKTKCTQFDGKEIALTRKEYGILEYLMLHKNQTIKCGGAYGTRLEQ